MTIDRVRTIWCRELGRDDVTHEDDFFALGGNSVVMARIQGAFLDELGVEVPADQMFSNPTIAATSAYIDAVGIAAP